MQRQITIIGGGPAGIACAIQLKRAGFDPLIIEKDELGGLLHSANIVENYPGFPKGIKGPVLASLFKEQAKKLKIKVIKEEINDISNIDCTHLVIASGTEPKILPFKNIEYSIIPLLNVKNKNIAIIGAGDAAFDYALNLAGKNRISILNRGDKIKALPLLAERASNIKNISYLANVDIEKEIKTKYDHILGAAGRVPALSFINPQKKYNKKIYYIGDVRNENYRQCSISIGDGIKTAMEIYNESHK